MQQLLLHNDPLTQTNVIHVNVKSGTVHVVETVQDLKGGRKNTQSIPCSFIPLQLTPAIA